jgi:uncharacterized membrane protein
MVEEMAPPTEVTDDDRLWALLSWIFWPIAVIVLLLEDKKNRSFIKYNAIQALALNVIAWATVLILIGACVGPLAFIYSIFLGIKSYQGEWVTVPFVTDFCKNQGWI